ncbi:MAG: hypothetical protein DRG69_06745, partial [Deltaproteobacteria bacterium]
MRKEIKKFWKNGFAKEMAIVIALIFLGSMGLNNTFSKDLTGNDTENGKNNYPSTDVNNEKDFALGEIIIKFKQDTPLYPSNYNGGVKITGMKEIDKINEKYGVISYEPLFDKSKANFSNIYKVVLPNSTNIFPVIKDFKKLSCIEYAEPNYIYHTCVVPNDPDFDLQWPLNQSSDHDIDAPEAWDIETGNESIVIAIIDTGVDWDHPDLSANIWNNTDEAIDGNDTDGNGYVDDIRGWDFVNNDNNPMDDNGHGTHCAGIAGAVTNNSIGIAGVCWNCAIMLVKGLNSEGIGYEDDLANAIIYAADNGADIISMSWGSYTDSNLIRDAIDYAYNKGVILVAAAGNDNITAKHYPAAYDRVIAVSATDNSDAKASFSNWGSWIDVAAPGVNIYSTYLNDTYTNLSGTSMSCPFVAGLAGLILSKTNFSQEEVRTILRSTCDNITSNQYIGIGRINAYKAIIRNSTPIADLNSSLDDAIVRGIINITGIANGSTFMNYTVYYGEGVYPSNWTEISNSTLQVNNSVLASWDTTLLKDGIYTIKLFVHDNVGQISEDRAVLTIDNVYLTYPLDNDIFRAGDVLEIKGNVQGSTFQNYTVEWGFGENPTEWFTTGVNLTNNGQSQIINGTLATWNTSSIAEANFTTIRLIANFTDFQIVEYIRNIYLDPTIMKGWPKYIRGTPYTWIGIISPVIADLNGDNSKELVVTTQGNPQKNSTLLIFNKNGQIIANVSLDSSINPRSFPSIADLDNDQNKEIVVAVITPSHPTQPKILVFDHFGNLTKEIPLSYSLSDDLYGSIVLEDIDNDGSLEFIYGGWENDGTRLVVLYNNGSMFLGFPVMLENT